MKISPQDDFSVITPACYSIFFKIVEHISSLPPLLSFTLILRDSFCAHSRQYSNQWRILICRSRLAEAYIMWHFTVPLDLTFGSGFATDSYLLLRLFSPFLCQYSTHLLSFWCLNDVLPSQESSTLNIFPANLVVNGRPERSFCALSLPSQHPLGHFNPRTLDKTSSPCAPRNKLKVWLEVFLNITHKKMYEGWNFNSGNYLFTTDTK